MDAGNMIKPMLARGELRMIGATTLDEYRKHIEKDAALERRFQQVYVGEPSVEDTIAILRGLKERYEVHHGVRIQDAALVAAAVLSDRYITGRFLPDKAIDLVDEAASQAAHRDRLAADRDRRGRAAHPPARDRAGRAGQGDRRAVPGAPRGARRGAGQPARADRRHDGPLGAREGGHRRDPRRSRRSSRACARRSSARPTSRRRPRSATAASPSSSARSPRRPPSLDELQAGGQRMLKEEVDDRGHRRGRRQVDRRPGQPAHGGRDGQARPPRGACCTSGSSARTRPSPPSPTPSAAAGPACPTRTGRSARSCSSARPASARPSWPGRWPSSSSTTSGRWSAST